jgi:hypothetical protein
MSDIPDNVVNKRLYQNVKDEAGIKYKRPGLYKSAWIVKTYVDRGGKYTGPKPEGNKGINRWLKKEEWIQVLPYLLSNEKVTCGSSEGDNIACRPMVRASKNTPITLPELLKLHSKDKLIKLARQKENNPDKRINWKSGTIK